MRTPVPHPPTPPPPLWREGRIPFEAAALLRDPIFRGEGMRDAGGQPVLLIPGFMAGGDPPGVLNRGVRRPRPPPPRARTPGHTDRSAPAPDKLMERPGGP